MRYFEDYDLHDFLEYRSDPTICRFQGFNPYTDEQAKVFLKENEDKKIGIIGDWIQLAIEDTALQKVIGDIGIKLRIAEPRIAELGYTINAKFQNKAYGTETLKLVLPLLFNTYNVRKIVLRIEPRNIASIKLAQKLNFHLDGILREEYYDSEDEDWFDEHIYSLLKSEYKNRIG